MEPTQSADTSSSSMKEDLPRGKKTARNNIELTVHILVRMELLTGTVPVNKELLTGTVPVNKE